MPIEDSDRRPGVVPGPSPAGARLGAVLAIPGAVHGRSQSSCGDGRSRIAGLVQDRLTPARDLPSSRVCEK